MVEIIETLSANFRIFVLSLGGAIAITALITRALVAVILGTARERSRREIAAYVAEGTMSAEQGERLIAAHVQSSDAE